MSAWMMRAFRIGGIIDLRAEKARQNASIADSLSVSKRTRSRSQ